MTDTPPPPATRLCTSGSRPFCQGSGKVVTGIGGA